MKFKLISYLAFYGLFVFTACDKKDSEPTEKSNVEKVNREQITNGNYNPNETTEERYFRIKNLRDVLQGTTPGNEKSASGFKLLKQSQSVCSQIAAGLEEENSQNCEQASVDCRDGGAYVKVTTNYGTEGCLYEGEMMVGEESIIYYDLFNLSEDDDLPSQFKSELELVNYGEIVSPKVFAFGTANIYIDASTGELDNSEVDVDFEIISANEILKGDIFLTLKEQENEETGELISIRTYKRVYNSDQGYSVIIETTEAVKNSNICNAMLATDEYPISGNEKVTITEGDSVEVLTVDYGDGSCDAVYTITDEDGNVTTMEYDEEIQ